MPPIPFRRLADRRDANLICGRDALSSHAIDTRRSSDGRHGSCGRKGVVAPINFIEPMAEKPYSYNYEPPPGVPPRNTREETHKVTILDARPVNDRLSLDREGFVLLRHPTAATDLYDEDADQHGLLPGMRAADPGGDRRQAGRRVRPYRAQRRRMAKGSRIKGYAGRVHNDYTAWSAPQRVRDLMGDEAEELLKHRYAEINVWRPIRGPLLRSPLALCDAHDAVGGEPRRLRAALSRPHRRDLCGHLQSGAALVLFPEDAGGRGGADPLLRLGALGRGAFLGARRLRRPETPANAPPRESIEVRALVFFAD